MAGRGTGRITVREGQGVSLRCPHCSDDLTGLDATVLHPAGGGAFGFGKRYAYSCPSCRAVLGVSHRKGFWMG